MSSITSSSSAEQYKFVRDLKVIIIDEVSMVSCKLIDCLNRSLKDICASNADFGGKFVIFGGDFRQILPVVLCGSRAAIADSCIKHSSFWPRVHRFSFTRNMRADPGAQEFSDFLLRVGNGELQAYPQFGQWSVALPNPIVMPFIDDADNELHLITHVFSAKLTPSTVSDYTEHAILCPTNETCMRLNNRIIDQVLDGDERIYWSFDQQVTDENEEDLDVPIESIHNLLPNGLPPHELKLKLGTIVMILRNLSSYNGIVNGTRGIVTGLHDDLLQLLIVSGKMKGEFLMLNRFEFLHDSSDERLALRFRRRQFPIRPAFAMTINKCQGQTLKRVGIFLDQPIFSHGQLYVAFSRVPNFDALRVLLRPSVVQGMKELGRGEYAYITDNVVYPEVLDKSSSQVCSSDERQYAVVVSMCRFD